MAKKKDFGVESILPDSIYNTMEQTGSRRGQQGTATPEEQKKRKSALRTQGRKGCKAVRINMAFTPENHRFIQVMSKATGHSMTEACNIIIMKYRHEHKDLLEKAQVVLDAFGESVIEQDFEENENEELL